MKKNSIYALMGAIALAGSVGFSSCTDKEVEDVSPNYDPASNSVVVDLALNISTSNTPTTRMSSAATQATTNDAFRGISDAQLFSFIQADNGKSLAAATAANKRYDLSQLVTTTQISATNSRRVLEMSLPLRTNTLVFYGRATKESTDKDNTHGAYVTNAANSTATNLSDLTFTVAQRLDNDKLAEYRKVEKLMAGILTCIMNVNLSHVEGDISKTATAGANAYGFDVENADFTNIKWSDYATGDYSPLTPSVARYSLEEQLSRAYIQVTTIRGDNGELRAASGEALILTIQDLWSAINKVRCAAPLCKEEAVAKRLAAEISERMAYYFTPQSLPNDGAAVTGVSFLENFTSIRSSFLADPFWPVNETEEGNSAYKRASYGLADLATTTDLGEFPTSYGLPRGASHVKFDGTKKVFYYPEDFNTSAVGGVPFTVEDYLFPPELAYFGNSPIRVSANPHKTTEYPNGANNNAPSETAVGGWNNESSWPTADWSSNYVTSASRSVAMKNDINYGTALLKTTIKYGTTSLRDNNHKVQQSFNPSITDERVGGGDTGEFVNEPDKTITVDGNSFELIGVIVGGQSRNVGWDFLPKKVGEPSAYKYGFISDDDIPTDAKAIPASGASGPNYTLVFDNYKASDETTIEAEQAAQDAVFIALEFRNNSGEDFYGNYNLIRQGGTFYLIGQLNPNATSNLTKINWESEDMQHYLAYHALPPYASDGTTKKINRVFIQDFMTSANFVIGENSLKYAYLTVPDLRSSSLTLGLSVDIKWETGLNFSDIVLGGNDY